MDEKNKFLNSLARLLLTNQEVRKSILDNIDPTPAPSSIPATSAAAAPVPSIPSSNNPDVPSNNPAPLSTKKKTNNKLFDSVDFPAKDLEPSSSNEEDCQPSNTSAFAKGTDNIKFSIPSDQALLAFPETSQSRLASCNIEKKWKVLNVRPDSEKAKPSGKEVITIHSDSSDGDDDLFHRKLPASPPNPGDAIEKVISAVLSGTKVLNSPTQLLNLFTSAATNVQLDEVEPGPSKSDSQSAAYRKGMFHS